MSVSVWHSPIQELVELCEKKKKETMNSKRRVRDKLVKLKKQRDASLGAFDAFERDPELFSLAGKKMLEEEDEVRLSSQFDIRVSVCI